MSPSKYWGWAPMMGLVPLQEETPESSLPLPASPPCGDIARRWPGRELSLRTESASILISDCIASRTMQNKCLWFKHPSLWYSVTTARAKTSRSKEPVIEFMRIQTVLSPHTGKVGQDSPRGTWAAQRVARYPSLGEDSPATLTEQCLTGLLCAPSRDPGRSLRRLEG